jgi:hypothetical protein
MPGWEGIPPLASPCTSSPSTIHGSIEWGRSVVLAGDISRSRAKYRPLHAACREIQNRNAHPLPATLLSGMAVAQIRRQIFWCRREARGTRPGSRARVVRLPMLPGHRADDPWSIDETADDTRKTMMRPLGVPDHRVGLKTEEGHDATSNDRNHHHAGALATARRGDVGFARRTV